MADMNKIRRMLCDELDKFSGMGTLSATDLEYIHKLTDTIKNIDKIEKMEEDGYSYGRGNWETNGSYGKYGRNYDGDRINSSYARRGQHYVRGHYSYGDDMRSRIEEMMESNDLTLDDKSALRKAMMLLDR